MKIYQPIAGFCLAALLSAVLSACSTAELQKFNNDLAGLNGALSGRNATTGATANAGGTLATMPAAEPDKKQVTQLVLPADPRIRGAIDAALPNVKKVLQIHQCVKDNRGMSHLNFLAVPGVNFINTSYDDSYNRPNSGAHMKYHDRNKCVDVRTIDGWTMPALNALQFRAVYFAEDSGETVNFQYLFKKVDDGSWKLESLRNIR